MKGRTIRRAKRKARGIQKGSANAVEVGAETINTDTRRDGNTNCGWQTAERTATPEHKAKFSVVYQGVAANTGTEPANAETVTRR